MKAGMHELHAMDGAVVGSVGSGTEAALREAIIWTAVGLFAYGISLLSWLAVLARYPLSFAYPILSLSYVLVYAGATYWPLLAEDATTLRTVGTLLILVGVSLVSGTGRREE